MIKEVRLIADNKDIHYSKSMTKEDARTHILTYKKATQCLTIKELIALMSSASMHIDGRGNGSVILMGCI